MPNPNGAPDRILIVGDESKSARALERLLNSAAYPTTSRNSFAGAVEAISTERVSLVVVDTAASRIAAAPAEVCDGDSPESARKQRWASDALSFCRGIREAAATADLPVLVICKSRKAQDSVVALNAGATDYITKPYHRAELLSRIKVHLRSWRYEREISDRFEELNLLHSVSSVLSSSLEPDVLLRGTLSVLLRTLRADAGVVYLRDSDERTMSLVAVEGFEAMPEHEAGLQEVYEKAAPLMEAKPLLLESPSELLELTEGIGRGTHALLCAPLGVKGRAVGAICLFYRKPSPVPSRLSELLSTICNQLSVALENARLYVETKKAAAQLVFVYNLGNNLMTSLEMDELLGYAVFSVGKSLECDVCAVVVRASGEGDSLASGIYSRDRSIRHEATSDWCHVDRVLSYLDKVRGSARVTIETHVAEKFLKEERIRVEAVVPLMFDDVILGILVCANYDARGFTEDECRLLAAVAQQLSLAIRNTELFRETKNTSINLAVEVARRTREIEEQKRFTEKIIDSLPVSLYVVDRDMRVVAWNRNRQVGGVGGSRPQVLGRNVFQVFARQPRRMLEEEFVDVFRSGEIVRRDQESWVEGQKKFWMISKIPMRVDNAEVTHVITVGEDVTDQKKMNDAVIRAEKLASIGRLAAGVVHEINNPLATIAACAESLTLRLEEIQDPELHKDFADYLQIIRDESFRCKTITNSLLDFSHQRQVDKMLGDINHMLDQTLQLLRHHPSLGRMTIIKELDASLPLVNVNEGQMKQIFIALISNAFDAMEGGGTLTIRTSWLPSETDPAVCVEFIDTGTGIPASNLQKIFDPFFTTKPLGRGTGLGLSVCYGIVSEHGGKIEVDSTEGIGSAFRVLLPVRPEQMQRSVKASLSEMEKAL